MTMKDFKEVIGPEEIYMYKFQWFVCVHRFVSVCVCVCVIESNILERFIIIFNIHYFCDIFNGFLEVGLLGYFYVTLRLLILLFISFKPA